jgi:PAS domain S-box-containing protein
MPNGPISRNAAPHSVTPRPGLHARAAGRDRLGRHDERFFKVFQTSPVAIILRTLSEGKVIDVNASYTELVGFPREELIGHTVHELGLWVDPSQGERVLDRLRRKGTVRNVEGRFRRKSGDIRDVLIWGELTEIQGETVVIGMIVDITERKRMETELRQSREQLRSLSAHLQQIREEERMRIARELHDELGGFLTVLKLDLASLGKEPTTGSPSFRQKIDSMSKAIVRAIGSVRRICSDLRPSMLDHIGLTAAIGWQVEEWKSKTGIRCTMSSAIDDESIDSGRATAAFRVLQEALTNVARHAHAATVQVRLWIADGRLRLEIHDDGCGIGDGTAVGSTSLGLLGMKERVYSYGGSVEIRGEPARGTTVDVSIPLEEPQSR